MVLKERCVCDICSCGKHHCTTQHKYSKTGKINTLQGQDGIFVASKAAFEYPDTLNLFDGNQDHKTIVKSDYTGHDKLKVERPKPTDQIGLGVGAIEGLTQMRSDYPGHKAEPHAPITVQAATVPKVAMQGSTSYAEHFPTKKSEITKPKFQADQLSGPEGELDLATINKSDYVARSYGRPVINKILDNDLFGVTSADLVAKDTTTATHFPGFASAPAQKAVQEDAGVMFGTDAGVGVSLYGADFPGGRVQPKVRKSKRRGTAVNFGAERDHTTSYTTQFQGEGVSKEKAASFKDELALFEGDQDLTTIARADYKGHLKVGVERRRPKDQIEIPSDKMTSDTVTLAHFPAPPIAPGTARADAGISDTSKGFDLSSAMKQLKMTGETSYKADFPKKDAQRTNKATFKDEIAPATGDIDLASLNRSDFVKFSYGRPDINKIDHNNILGINYELGKKTGLLVESAPPSRGETLQVTADVVEDVSAAFTGNKKKAEESNIRFTEGGEPYSTTYKSHYLLSQGPGRSTKKRDAVIDFGGGRYLGTSYGDHYTEKKCLVPSLPTLPQYTFKQTAKGHQVYEVNCGCPPKGACGCTPPPTAAAVH